MKRIFNTLKDKWPEYLLEILVITIGILGAFLLNNWNEDRKLTDTARVHLEVLNKDLNSDLKLLESLSEKMRQSLIDGADLMNQFKRKIPVSNDAYRQITELIFEYTFAPQTTGINSLQNSGSLTILEEELQQQISKYYISTEYISEREDISNNFIRDKYEPKLFHEYALIWSKENSNEAVQQTYSDDLRSTELLDTRQFLNDKKLEVLVFGRMYQTQTQKDAYDGGIREIRKLLEMLKEKNL